LSNQVFTASVVLCSSKVRRVFGSNQIP